MSNLESHRSKPPVSTMAPAQALLFDSVGERDWLNPIAMSILQKAVKRKDRYVTLNGIHFAITYNITTTFKASGETRECIKLKRIDGGFAPFGYITLRTIMDFQFEENRE